MHAHLSTHDRRWRNRPLVLEKDDRHARFLWIMLLGIVAALAPAGAYLLFQNSCLKAEYDLAALQAENERLIQEERRLKIERAGLEELPSVEAWAASNRELAPVGPDEVIVVRQTTADSGDLMARAPGGRANGKTSR